MAGCGKSTIGEAVSTKLGISFVDTDLLIEEKHNSSLEELKNKYDYKFLLYLNWYFLKHALYLKQILRQYKLELFFFLKPSH